MKGKIKLEHKTSLNSPEEYVNTLDKLYKYGKLHSAGCEVSSRWEEEHGSGIARADFFKPDQGTYTASNLYQLPLRRQKNV